MSTGPQKLKFHVVVWQSRWKIFARKRAARAARLFFLVQPIKAMICGFVVAFAVVIS